VRLEDFCIEIVPAVRRDISEERIDEHCHQFLTTLKDSPVLTITYAELDEMVTRLNLEQRFLAEAVQAVGMEKARAPEDGDRNAARKAGRNPTGVPPGPDEVLRFDFEATHEVLMYVEEQTDRIRRSKERRIKDATRLPDVLYWRNRQELLGLHDTFTVHDVDNSGFLGHDEAKKLLKCTGLQPYTRSMEGAVNDFLSLADKDGNQEIDFGEFVVLMERAREHQCTKRQAKLWKEFEVYDADRSGSLDAPELLVCLRSAGLVKSKNDSELALTLIREFDTDHDGSISFNEFEELCQRIVERIFSSACNRSLQRAKIMGVDVARVAEYQWAFDHLDANGTGALSLSDVQEALRLFMARPPSMHEVEEVFKSIDVNSSGDISFEEFLLLMNQIEKGKGMFRRGAPFTLRDVPVDKLRDVLGVFPIADGYIRNLEPGELLETVGNFLGLKVDANLRDLPKPVRNGRQLLEHAKVQVRGKVLI